MKFRDYHVHLENGPYTIEWLKKFFDEGSKKGVVEIGFSEHGHRFKEAVELTKSDGFRGTWTKGEATQSIEDYIKLIEQAKSLGFAVKLGIEMDYIPEYEDEIRKFINYYPFAYVIGSVHWLGDFGFDHPDLISEWDAKDVDQIYDEYFEILMYAIKSGIFDVMAHLDVIKVFGHRAKQDLTAVYDKLAEAIKEQGLCAEVSTAGFRKPVGEIYPAPLFMKYLAKYNIPIMINSDAHFPEDVGKDFDKALEFVKEYGYDQLYYFK